MNAPERLPVERTAIEGAVHIPLALITASPTNPRRHHADQAAEMKAWNLAELADSIGKHGVIQPILVRPRPGAKPDDGTPQYEIVAGERRWRASQLAGRTDIMTIVRSLTDFEVLELQVIENLQREGLQPLEEAEGYAKLIRKADSEPGYRDAAELAARIGKSERYIYNRLSLLDLLPEARDALYDGRISTSVALLISTIKDREKQATAIAHLVAGWGGRPYTYLEAQQYVKGNFMRELAKAGFDIAAVYQVAGPCGQCQKRTGANPDLFADIQQDMCNDGTCFQAKTDEAHAARLAEAEAKGYTIVRDTAARKIFPYHGSRPVGHHHFNKPCPDLTDSRKPLSELLGEGFKSVVMVEMPHTSELVPVVAEGVARKALKTKGLLREEKKAESSASTPAGRAAPPSPPAKPMDAKQLERRKQELEGELFGKLAFTRLHEAIAADEQLPTFALRLIVRRLAQDMYHEAAALIYETRGWNGDNRDVIMTGDFERRIDRMTPRELAELGVELLICDDCANATSTMGNYAPEPDLVVLAREYKVDLKAIEKAAKAEAAAKVKAEQQERQRAADEAAAATKQAKAAKSSRAKGASTPTSSAAAQGAKSRARTPEQALADSVASNQADPAGEPAKAASKPTKGKDQPASPEGDEAPSAPGPALAVNDRVKVRNDARGPTGHFRKCCGKAGTVIVKLDADAVMVQLDGSKEKIRLEPRELEIVSAADAQPRSVAKLSPTAAWPFPTGEGKS